MLKIFCGMIIGSIMTMMLLGGASAADQVLANAQNIYSGEMNRPDTTTTLLLLVITGILMGAVTLWPTKPILEKKTVINRLRRHCR